MWRAGQVSWIFLAEKQIMSLVDLFTSAIVVTMEDRSKMRAISFEFQDVYFFVVCVVSCCLMCVC